MCTYWLVSFVGRLNRLILFVSTGEPGLATLVPLVPGTKHPAHSKLSVFSLQRPTPEMNSGVGFVA